MSRKNKPSFTVPRKQEMHKSFPRIFRKNYQHEETEEKSGLDLSQDSSIMANKMDIDDTDVKKSSSTYPYSILTESSHKKLSEDDDKVKGQSLTPLRSVPRLNWNKLYSNAVKIHAKNQELVSCQQEKMELTQAIGLMQNIAVNDFERTFYPMKYNSGISLAQHMCMVKNRRLDPVELLTIAVRNYWFDNLELKIGNAYMHVDRYLFGYYMEAFRSLSDSYLELPSHKAPMHLMALLYNWIINDNNELALGNEFLVIYTMAKFLEVRYLLEQYWHAFTVRGMLGFCEQEAFKAYLGSRMLKCTDLMSVFLARIHKCFLPLVASLEFVNLNINEMIYLLNMDTICVNSEDEIFFAAIRWLEYDFPNRVKHIVEIMSSLRFRMLSPWVQRAIAFQPENDVIRQVGSNPVIKALLWKASLDGQACLIYNKNPNNIDSTILENCKQIQDVDRFWVYCPGVPHHHDFKCPRFRRLTYGTFKVFLNRLQQCAQNYMDAIMRIPYKHWNTYSCCIPFECNVRPKFSRPPT